MNMKKEMFSIALIALMMIACGGKKAQAETSEAAVNDSTVIVTQEKEAQEKETPKLTFANMAGIYDDENQESRFCLNSDGTATWGMIGSLNYTEYTYTINGNTICLKPKDVDSEEDCYDYDENTRTLKNEQGAVYYRE